MGGSLLVRGHNWGHLHFQQQNMPRHTSMLRVLFDRLPPATSHSPAARDSLTLPWLFSQKPRSHCKLPPASPRGKGPGYSGPVPPNGFATAGLERRTRAFEPKPWRRTAEERESGAEWTCSWRAPVRPTAQATPGPMLLRPQGRASSFPVQPAAR